MNTLQTIFTAITGFKASDVALSTGAEGWEEWNPADIQIVANNLDLGVITIEEAEELYGALREFRECSTGKGVDLDKIFDSVGTGSRVDPIVIG